MSIRMKLPGSALQRATGANFEEPTLMNPSAQTYATLGEFQRRRVMRRCGIGGRQASLIAALFFGEDSR